MDEEMDVPPVSVTVRVTGSIRIVSAPPGEAPLEIRQKWIGLVLPIVGEGAVRAVATFGVVTGPRSRLGALWCYLRGKTERMKGYPVESRAALALLEGASLEAGQWWRTNAPHYFRPKQFFLFDEACCERVDGAP